MDLDEGFRELADSAPLLIWIRGDDRLCTWYNRVWLDFVGRRLEQELGDGWVENVHPEDAERCLRVYRMAFDARQPFTMEYRLRRHDGQFRWILDTGTPCNAEDGVFHGYIGSGIDVTERKLVQQVLRETEERGRMLAEALPNLVWTCEPDGWCDYLSRQWVAYTGRPAEEQVGYGWAEHVHPDDRSRVREAWKAATLRGDTYDIEFRIRNAGGTYRWFRTRAVPVRDEAGRITKWFGSNTDCDDYKRAERELKLQLERVKVNQFAPARRERQALPASREPSPQRVCRPSTPGPRSGPRRCQARRRRDMAVVRRAPELPDRREGALDTGQLRSTEVRQLRTANSDLERRIRQRTLELEVANEEIEAFCQFATQDARSPLRALRGLSQAVGEDFTSMLPLRAVDMVRRLDVNADQMEKLVNDLLWLGRLSRRPMSRTRVDLDLLVARVMNDLVQTQVPREIRIRAGELGACVGDPSLLEQVFAHLLSNALECTRHRERTLIEVGRSEEDQGPVYFVRDNGMGFDMNHAQRLFTPFQRLHAEGSNEGTGVGLAAVYRIVQRHGGEIWAEAAPGRGATFYFTIPTEV